MQSEDQPTPRRARAAFAAATIIAAIFAPFTASAADPTRLEVAQTAWFWSSNQKYTFCAKDPALGACQAFILSDAGPRGVAPVPPGTLTTISYGHLGVSLIQGSPDMRSYVKLDLSAIPADSAIDSLILRMKLSLPTGAHLQNHLDARGRVPGTFNEMFAAIDACPMAEPWGPAEGDAPYAYQFQRPELERQSTDINLANQRNEPASDCGAGRIRGKLTKDGTGMEWDLTRLAQEWVDDPVANEGVALIGVAEGPVSTWTVELHGGELTLGATTPGVPVGVPVPLPDPDLADSVYVGPEHAAFGTATYHAKPIVLDPPLIGDPAPQDPVIIIQPGTSEQVFVSLPQPPPETRVVYAAPTVPTAAGEGVTPAWVFLAFPLGLLGMGALFGVLGTDPLTNGAAVPLAGSRVATMLRARRLH